MRQLKTFQVHFAYNNVEDLCVIQAYGKNDAIIKAQLYFNKHKDFADVQVRVYNAVAV